MDMQVIKHMFVFDNGIPLTYSWPQGLCHKRGVIEQVLAALRERNGGSRVTPYLPQHN